MRTTLAAAAQRGTAGEPSLFAPLVLLALPSALGLAGYAITGQLLAATDTPGTPRDWANLWTTLAVYPLSLFALWLLSQRRESLPALIGFERQRLGRDLLIGLAIAVLGFATSAVVGFGMNFVVYTAEQRAAFLAAMQAGDPLGSSLVMPRWYGWFSLLVQPLAAGVTEELLYRGVALRGLRGRMGAAGTVLLSALAFGLQHWAFTPLDWQFGLARLVSLGAVGVVFGVIALRQGRLLPLIIGHTIWNVLLIGLPVLLASSDT
jgi:uncharacterized protein